jgi:hypothetical protein
MHRMKIGLVAAAVILALTVAEYAMVTGPLKDGVTRDVEDAVGRGQRLHSELARLEALDFTNLVATLSRRAGTAAVFDRPDEHGRRQAASARPSTRGWPRSARPTSSPSSTPRARWWRAT